MQKFYLLLPIASLLLLSGCNKVTKANYDNLKVGMPYNIVIKHIGKPAECSETLGVSSCIWKNGEAMIDIKFISSRISFLTAKDLK